jgi:hypothetical protein
MAAALRSSIFVGDVELTNVIHYIHQCHVINERILYYLLILTNLQYIHQLNLDVCTYGCIGLICTYAPMVAADAT